MLTDFHNHFLSEIDDGAETVKVSARMCEYSFSQGIKRIVATPHFHADYITINDFLKKRGNAFKKAKKINPYVFSRLRIQLGSEVALTQGLSSLPDIDKLTIAHSKYIVIELPIYSYDKWVDYEVNALVYRRNLIPIFSNIERYQIVYPSDVFNRLLHTPKAVFQINTRSLSNKSTRTLLKNLLKNNHRVLLGTNAHNMNSRAPEWTFAREWLKELLGETGYNVFVLQNNAFLNPKLIAK